VINKLIIRPAAQADIDEQAAYLAEHAGEVVAYRFLSAIEETTTALLKMPDMGAPWVSDHPRLQNIRRCSVAGFPNHLFFYRHEACGVEVLHLYHGSEDVEARLNDAADAPEDETGRTS
jgi:plasmid stabilization system protein ParE